ncbi:hypothetical protein MTP03_18750 [Tsukamurella sp. PLM1]|nr:hypothetical protein MTP03_18750 [Tsukamurella sp. PLM1]
MVAKPVSSDASVKPATPKMNMRFRPKVSPNLPPSSMNPPKVTAYAPNTQIFAASDRCMASWIRGSATNTTVPSSTARNIIPDRTTMATPRALPLTRYVCAGLPGAIVEVMGSETTG